MPLEIAVAVFTEGFHVEGVVITEIPLVLLGEKTSARRIAR